MADVKRLASSVLLAAGIVLVFAGLSASLGFTVGGMVASIALIAALLYAGGSWFGAAPPAIAVAGADRVLVFDRTLHIAAGAAPGTPLLSQFPEPLRPEIEVRCRAALGGEHSHFACEHGGRRIQFEIAPVQPMAGAVLYGILIAGTGAPLAAVASRPLTTVA
jgi:hypothetical protein